MVQQHRLYAEYSPGIDGAGIDVSALLGVFIKSVTAAGLVTYQDASDAEQTVQLAVGGATVTTSFIDPTVDDGAGGDLHFKVDAQGVILSIWFRSPQQWAQLGLPGDGTVLNGNGAPAGNSGKDGDTYRDDVSGAWHKKASGCMERSLVHSRCGSCCGHHSFPSYRRQSSCGLVPMLLTPEEATGTLVLALAPAPLSQSPTPLLLVVVSLRVGYKFIVGRTRTTPTPWTLTIPCKGIATTN